jgi:branched-chain amino acid aminotransferase
MAFAELASVDGEISATAEARIPLPDDGVYRGDGVFEVIRLYGGRPYALADHLDRIERSAAKIELPVDRPAVEREVAALLDAFGDADGALRIVLTRGGRRIAVTEPLPDWPQAVSVATVTYAPSVILTGVKSISYAANMQATRIAASRGADEAILVRPDGIVLEAPTSAIFWVSPEGDLRTPSISTGILESITRARVARELHVEEGEWNVDDLLGAGEAFLASTTREVQAISAIDGRELPHSPGPRTEEAIRAFERVIDSELGQPHE